MVLQKRHAVVEVERSVETLAAKTELSARRYDPRVEQYVARAYVDERALALDDARKTFALTEAPAPARHDVTALRRGHEKDRLPRRAEQGRHAPGKGSRPFGDDRARTWQREQVLEDEGESLLPHGDRPLE